MLRVFVMSLLLVTTLITGCEDQPPRAERPDRDEIEAGIAALFAGDHPTAEDTQTGTCFATELLARSTPEQLRTAGVLDASYGVVADLPTLERPLAETWVDAQFACTDFITESARAQVQISHGAIDEEAYVACLTAALSPEQVRAAVIDTLTGTFDSPAVTRLSKAQLTCSQQAKLEVER